MVIGFYLSGKYEALAGLPPEGFTPIKAWVQIAPNDSVTLLIAKSEMGQGKSAALVMVLADELDLDWKKVKSEFAPAAPQYFNPIFGLQDTGGSCSVRGPWNRWRKQEQRRAKCSQPRRRNAGMSIQVLATPRIARWCRPPRERASATVRSSTNP